MNFNDYYRPSTFSDILGQDITTSIISKELAMNKIPKAYVFVGPAGSGKTSLARIIAKELGSTPIELNGAVANGVDDMRALNEDANHMSFDGGYKVYLLDECHRVTKQAWGAALKLFEEPPENVLFILCTTEVEKIPKTILSRAQIFYFQSVPTDKIQERLGIICNENNIDFEPEALYYLANSSMGCVREAIQKLEQVSVLDKITLKAVKEILPDADIFEDILLRHNFDRVSDMARNSVSIDSLIKEALRLTLEDKFPREVSIGLVKLRPYLDTPFDPEVVRVYLEGAFGNGR